MFSVNKSELCCFKFSNNRGNRGACHTFILEVLKTALPGSGLEFNYMYLQKKLCLSYSLPLIHVYLSKLILLADFIFVESNELKINAKMFWEPFCLHCDEETKLI